MPVGGSRHYQGSGLGTSMWECPACGAENAGPLERGCSVCGSGVPGRKVLDPAPAAAPPPAAPGPDTDAFLRWRHDQPELAGLADDKVHLVGVTIADAFRAGFHAGIQYATTHAMTETPHLAPEGKITRTMIAALELFRDQVLASNPEEVRTGEWCSASEIRDLITHLRRQTGAVHA